MRGKIDEKGRVRLPLAVRRKAGLKPGSEITIRCRGGTVEIQPVFLPARLEQRGRFPVVVPEIDVPPLTVAEVNKTLRRVRDRQRT